MVDKSLVLGLVCFCGWCHWCYQWNDEELGVIICSAFGDSKWKLAGWFKDDLYLNFLVMLTMNLMAELASLLPILKILVKYVYNFLTLLERVWAYV